MTDLVHDHGRDPYGRLVSDDWFRHAVFYEVMVRSFADSNADGVGDLAGITGKLDYLQWLGIDCVWLPPFYTSPMRDGGYDVADFRGVRHDLGTLEEFQAFLEAAHHRGIRVVVDFVMNHTSDEHPWFIESRTDPSGPYGDFYVWRDDDSEYADARIIFLDTEVSNWSYDDVRGQYFWHRFYSFQPDLNYRNPRVLAEVMDAIRFWLDLGVDGFRLDAVPYLIEEDGTNCENLPGTHAILKKVRAMIDAEYPGRIMLCEANQWPQDVVEYFGDGDECQMAFHFPVMPRLYMAIRKHDRSAISGILADTPPIPDGCQWGTFLRNHDELTLEMVTPDERDWMWSVYAPDERMKSNLGIRRRLATLVDNDPRQIKLLNALLLALPGSPVLYYGDEIGMGDDIWMHDRDGVRTPMQWDPEPNMGFSEAPITDWYLPPVRLEGFTPGEVNVHDQSADPQSLLHWTRGMLTERRTLDVLGAGEFIDLGGDNPAVLAFRRTHDLGSVWMLANLSDLPQRVTGVDLPARLLHRAPGEAADAAGGLSKIVDSGDIELPAYGYAWLVDADA